MEVGLKLRATPSGQEVSRVLGLGSATVYEAGKNGDLPGAQIGKRSVISRKRIHDLLGCPEVEIAAAMDNARTGRATG